MRALLAVWLLLVALPAWAQGVQVQLEPSKLQVGQTGRMTVYLVGEKTRGAPQVTAPEGVELAFDGSYQRMQSNGFDRLLVYAYRYRVRPLREGTFDLGGWDITFTSGKSATAPVSRLEVVPHDASTAEVEVKAGFNVTEAWEGQVVIYDYELQCRQPTMGVDWRFPDFTGLRPTKTGVPVRREYAVEDGQGGVINVQGGAVPFVVDGVGDLTQPGALVTVRIPVGDPGFLGLRQYRQERAVGDPTPLVARRLPDAPPGFEGLVGDLQVRGKLDKPRAAVGESVNWTVEVVGDAALDGWEPPELPATDGISVYGLDGVVEAWVRDGRYDARGRFPRVLVPSKPGTIELPAVEIIAFSPSQGRYVTHRVSPGTLTVTEGREQAVDVESFAGETPASSGGETIDFRGNYRWGFSRVVRLFGVAPVAGGLFALPAFAVLGLAVIERVKRDLERRRAANDRPPTVAERLADLPEDRLERLAALDAVMRQALAEKVGVPLVDLDRDRALTGLPADLAERLRVTWRALDRARFASGPSDGLEDAVRSRIAELAR